MANDRAAEDRVTGSRPKAHISTSEALNEKPRPQSSHGSWLDLAESELGVLSAQCLDRRIPDKHTLIDEIAAWQHDRNINNTKSDWHFTTKDARIKLKHLYPLI